MASILLADLNALHLDLVRTMLERAGHSVTSTASVRQCLGQLGASRPDAVVAELSMQDRNGLSLVKAIRAQDWRLPIIGMTSGLATVNHAITDGPAARGADTMLCKPFTSADLTAALERLLPSDRPIAADKDVSRY